MNEPGGDSANDAPGGAQDYPPPAVPQYPGYGSSGQPPAAPGVPQGPPLGYQPPPGFYAPPGYQPTQPRPAYVPTAHPDQPSYGYAPPIGPSDGLGVAAMVLGIIGAVLGFLIIGIVPAILAVIFGIIVRKRAKRGLARNGGQALAGLITGIVGIVISLGMIAVVTVAAVDLRDCQNNAQTQQEYDNCSN